MQHLFARYCRNWCLLVVFEEKGGNPPLNVGVGHFLAVKMLDDFDFKKIVHNNIRYPMPDIILGKPVNRFHTLL